MFNCSLPWIGGECAIKETIRPLQIAYHEYMRTYTGCMRSTPIPLLHAISRFPILKDRIVTDSALTVTKAETQGTLLGEDYRIWDKTGCDVDGWTPFGRVRYALEKTAAKKYEAKSSSTDNHRLKKILRRTQEMHIQYIHAGNCSRITQTRSAHTRKF